MPGAEGARLWPFGHAAIAASLAQRERACRCGLELINSSNDAAALLDHVGGDPLAGSGFETEESQAEFEANELIHTERQAPEEE